MTAPPRLRAFLRTGLGYVLAGACLVWVLHDVNLADLGARMTHLDWKWVCLAIVVDIASYVCQGWRWNLLLKPLGSLGVPRATQAIYAGLFTNEILPLRAGEFVRAYLVSRWMKVPVACMMASVLVERLLDGIWLVFALGITILAVPLPKHLVRAADFLGIGLLLALSLFLIVIFRRNPDPDLNPAAPAHLLRRLGHDLRNIGRSGRLSGAALASFLFLATQMTAFWLVMYAYGMRLSFLTGAAVLLIVHLGTAIPNAPANTGTFQFFCVLGLEIFGVGKTQAAAFSFVVFFVLTIPLWVLGLCALTGSGLALGSMRNQLRKAGAWS